MTFGELFSGIGGFRIGLERAGHVCKWACEIDPFCRRVYLNHWPDTEPFYEDIRDIEDPPYVDMLCGGFPCQGLSVAGERRGLADERSGLFWEFVRVVERMRPRWIFLENVPGFLSSNNGSDFGLALAALDKCGYGLAWRILNAQYFGVPQRRRRVWIVGYLGGPCPAEILFESQGGSGNSSAIGKAGAEVAGSITPGTHRVGSRGADDGINIVTARSLRSRSHPNSNAPGRGGEDDFNLVVAGTVSGAESHNGNSNPIPQNYIIQGVNTPRLRKECGIGIRQGGPMYTLNTAEQHAVSTAIDPAGMRETSGVPRRLDPPDGPRYKALGNAVPVPVILWIGERMMEAERHV